VPFSKTRPIHYGWLVIVLLVTTFLAARNLNSDGLWYDEWWSLYNSGAAMFSPPLSPAEIWDRIATDDIIQPPGYPWALSAWGNLVGWTEYSGRLLSLLAGVLAVAIVYRIGASLTKKPLVGMCAALIMAGSAWHVYYMHEMRVYAVYVCCTALVLLLYIRVMNAPRPTALHYVSLALAVALLIYTHYYATLVLAALGMWHLVRFFERGRDRRWMWVLLACVIGGATLLPWLDVTLRAVNMIQASERVPQTLQAHLAVIGDMLYGFAGTQVALLLLLAYFSFAFKQARTLFALLAVIVVLSLFANQVLSLNEIRYAMAVLPLMALIAGMGMVALIERRVPLMLLVALWFVSGLFAANDYDYNRVMTRTFPQPFREMAWAVEPYLQADDLVINIAGNDLVTVIQGQPFHHYFAELVAREEIVERIPYSSPEHYAARVAEAVGDAERVFTVQDPRYPSEEWALFEYLMQQDGFTQCATIANQQDMRIVSFVRGGAQPTPAQFDDGRISASLLGAQHVHNGVMYAWVDYTVAHDVPTNTYSTGLHVLDANSALITQADFALPQAGRTCRLIEIPMAGVPDGAYQLNVVVYDWRTGERLTTAQSNEQSIAPLTEFTYSESPTSVR
jgi:Dolichyl-phosphate-mannose-protein mannosyltransferase